MWGTPLQIDMQEWLQQNATLSFAHSLATELSLQSHPLFPTHTSFPPVASQSHSCSKLPIIACPAHLVLPPHYPFLQPCTTDL